MTYAGRLDPMASGVLLVLAGDEAKKKEKYLKLDKEYKFQVLFGFATDTYDILGKVRARKFMYRKDGKELKKEIKENLKHFTGLFMQEYPMYSSRTVNGRPLFSYARGGEAVESPAQKVSVKSLALGSMKKIASRALLRIISNRVKKVKGDFRQDEILKVWAERTFSAERRIFYRGFQDRLRRRHVCPRYRELARRAPRHSGPGFLYRAHQVGQMGQEEYYVDMKQYEEDFKRALEGLNDAQKKAVKAIDGPVMVIAGPGTGKTQILTFRIANILNTHNEPESILALTYTTAGVISMRERLVNLIGDSGYRVNIFTFHAFCEHLIKEFPFYFSALQGARVVTDLERVEIIESIIQKK